VRHAVTDTGESVADVLQYGILVKNANEIPYVVGDKWNYLTPTGSFIFALSADQDADAFQTNNAPI